MCSLDIGSICLKNILHRRFFGTRRRGKFKLIPRFLYLFFFILLFLFYTRQYIFSHQSLLILNAYTLPTKEICRIYVDVATSDQKLYTPTVPTDNVICSELSPMSKFTTEVSLWSANSFQKSLLFLILGPTQRIHPKVYNTRKLNPPSAGGGRPLTP